MSPDQFNDIEQREYLASLPEGSLGWEIHQRVQFGQKPIWERMLLKPPQGWIEGGLLMAIWDQLAWWRWPRKGD